MCKGSLKVEFRKLAFGVSALMLSTSAQSALLVGSFNGHVTDSVQSVSGQFEIDTELFDSFSTTRNIDVLNNSESLDYWSPAYLNYIRYTSFSIDGSEYILPTFTGGSGETETLGTEISYSGLTSWASNNMTISDSDLNVRIGLTLQNFDFLSSVNSIPSFSSDLLIGQGFGNYLEITSEPNALFITGINTSFTIDHIEISEVPIPAAAWLFGSGLIGIARRKKA